MERKVGKDARVREPMAARNRKEGEADDPEELRRAEEELPDDAVEPDQPTFPPPPPEGTETTEPVRKQGDRDAGAGERSD
jgi:hypothetical protein